MRKILLLTAIILFSGTSFLFAQISQGGIPPSFKNNLNSEVDRVELQPMSSKNVLAEDSKFIKDGTPQRIGYSLNTALSPENSGTWTELPEGGRIWQLQIKSPSALALGIYYDHFHLPVGSKLFLYNEDKTQVIGAFTWLNNDESGVFATEMIHGDIVNLEYVEPKKAISKPIIHINEVAYFYRGVTIQKNPTWTEPSEACEVNINCSPVGDNWQDEKQGVARMYIKIGPNSYWCTGSLVNNTNQDCTPYFLSAYHCYEGASAADLNQWIFYFNYESSGCTTPTTQPGANSMTGASLKAAGNISGGSDFILLQLNQTVPVSYNPYMNGWNRANSVTGPGVCIHHPAGSIKKISTFNSASSYTAPGSASNAHWLVYWVSNDNGWGVTEGGSSGSPIFDANSRIAGTLTRGSSYCTSQSDPDYYGKLYYHWNLNGSTADTRLKDWLDPAGSNPVTLDGKNCGSTSSPVAHFVGNPTTVNVGGQVVFTNQSTGTITSYSWSFAGGTPSTATGVGPHTITYNTAGVYNASLTVTDGITPNTLTETNYITVTNIITCDTIYPASFTSETCNLAIYYADVSSPYDSGFVSGQNAYLDKEKAMLYTWSTVGTISDVFVMYGLKAGTTGNTSVKIYNSSSGVPGSLIGTSATIVKSAIDTTNQGVNYHNKYHFTTPVNISSDFFVSVVLPTTFTSGTNELAIWSSQYTCSSTSSLAYELWSNNTWYSFSTVYETNIDLAIFPIVCSQAGISEIENTPVSVFPNPAGNEIFIIMPYPASEKVNISIIDIYGKLCKQIEISSNMEGSAKIDLSGLSNGIYLLQGQSARGKFIEKISVIK